MAELAGFLTPFTGRIGQDRTGPNGCYGWELTFGRGDGIPATKQPGNALPPVTAGRPPVMVALREQLGLHLEPTVGPVEILVIDSAALPEPTSVRVERSRSQVRPASRDQRREFATPATSSHSSTSTCRGTC